MAYDVTLIPGDGTGPEIMAATRRAIEATGVPVDWDVQEAGAKVIEAEGTPQSLKERVKDPTVHVELADPADAEAAREALAGLGTVEPANERTPSRIALQTPAGKGAIAPVIRALDEHGVVVEFVEVETPTLDDVFVAVTGAHLEGAAAAEEAVA